MVRIFRRWTFRTVFSPPIEQVNQLVVPTICLFEVFKRVLQQRGENPALQAADLMQQGTIVTLDSTLALNGAKLGLEHKVPMADAIILATAQSFNTTLWTQDADFQNLPNVRYTPKFKNQKK